jgi:hypothetical protein
MLTHMHPKKDDYAKAVVRTEKEIMIYKLCIASLEKATGVASKPAGVANASGIGTKRGNDLVNPVPDDKPELSKKHKVVKSLFDLGLNNDGSLQAKSHQSYDKATIIEKGQKWYAVIGYQVPPHQLQASITRAKYNWRTYVPGQPYEEAPIGDIPKFLRKDIRNVGRGLPRPRTLLHYAEHHEIHKLNALVHDVALLNDETPSEKHQAIANLDAFFPRTRTMRLDKPN